MKKLALLAVAFLAVTASLMSLQAGAPNASSDFTNRLKDIERRVMAGPKDSALPAGTIVLSLSKDCPAGFSRAQALDGLFIKGASATEAPGLKGGAATHKHAAVLDIAHEHTVRSYTERPRFMGFGKGGKEFDRVADDNHQHDINVRTETMYNARKTVEVQDAANAPPYAAVLFCAKE